MRIECMMSWFVVGLALLATPHCGAEMRSTDDRQSVDDRSDLSGPARDEASGPPDLQGSDAPWGDDGTLPVDLISESSNPCSLAQRPCEETNSFGTCSGTQTCVGGVWQGCTAATPAAEACDSMDNDCDGTTDEGCQPLDPFSFFMTSLASMQDLSGSDQGFGGDLRFGETGAGAGLRGADRICATIAEMSMPGSAAKQWRAFLSATADENGNPVNAIDRIGTGPWYDRMGRLFANNLSELLHDRPLHAASAIKNDFPNEWGVPNHRPIATQAEVDNHDTLTGSNNQGRLYSATATCLDWTSARGNTSLEGRPRVGHSWPTNSGGPGGHGGPGPGPGGNEMNNWMSALTENGCAAGVHLIQDGAGNPNELTVGAGGGYGAIYCFALTP